MLYFGDKEIPYNFAGYTNTLSVQVPKYYGQNIVKVYLESPHFITTFDYFEYEDVANTTKRTLPLDNNDPDAKDNTPDKPPTRPSNHQPPEKRAKGSSDSSSSSSQNTRKSASSLQTILFILMLLGQINERLNALEGFDVGQYGSFLSANKPIKSNI